MCSYLIFLNWLYFHRIGSSLCGCGCGSVQECVERQGEAKGRKERRECRFGRKTREKQNYRKREIALKAYEKNEE